MKSRFLLLACALGIMSPTLAQDAAPGWAVSAVSKKTAPSVKPALTEELGFQSEDFNGDGKEDVAMVVKEAKTGKLGLAMVHGGTNEVILLGAGTAFGALGDDFKWLDRWAIEPVPSRNSQNSRLGLWLAGTGVDGWVTWQGRYTWVPAVKAGAE